MKIYFAFGFVLFLFSNFVLSATEEDRKPQIVKCKRPEFPVEALKSRHTGKVSVLLTISIDGRITKTEVVNSSGHSDLDEAAKKSYRHCVFSPEIKNGSPVESTFIMSVDWSFIN